MEFGIEKCTMLILKSEKRKIMEGIELLNKGRIRTLRKKENYKYLGVLDADTIKKWKWKEKLEKSSFLMSRVFANGSGDRGSILGRVIPKTQKMVPDAALLNTQHYKIRIKSKVEQTREWSSALLYTSV